jgi:hypothetical protein
LFGDCLPQTCFQSFNVLRVCDQFEKLYRRFRRNGSEVLAGSLVSIGHVGVGFPNENVQGRQIENLLQFRGVLFRFGLRMLEGLKGLGIGNCNGALIGKHAQPDDVLLLQCFSALYREDAEHVFPHHQGMADKAADLFFVGKLEPAACHTWFPGFRWPKDFVVQG